MNKNENDVIWEVILKLIRLSGDSEIELAKSLFDMATSPPVSPVVWPNTTINSQGVYPRTALC